MNALAACSLFALLASTVVLPPRSDPTGVFAILDSVVCKPTVEQPTEIELHGAFAVAEGRHGDYYRAPSRGVLRFVLGSNRDGCLAQWRELQKHAGTGAVVAFSSRYAQHSDGVAPVCVAESGANVAAIPYDCEFPLHKVEGVDYGPVRELSLLPKCDPAVLIAPQQGRRWFSREVTFVCRNAAAKDKDLGYVFEVTTNRGDRFASGVVAAGAERTSWTTDIAVQPGDELRWSVHVVGAKVARAPLATAAFVVPVAAGAAGR